MKSQVCMICHDNQASQLQHRLRAISETLRDVEPTKYHNHKFNWNFNTRCKYGMRCDNMVSTVAKIKREINEINDKLVTVALSSDLKIYHRILQLLQGQFPAIYNQMVCLHSHSE